jgi:uncharacterized protein (TIGR02588 family)
MTAAKQSEEKNERGSSAAPRTRPEWVSLIVSLLLLGALIGVIVSFWIQDQGRPATFQIEKGPVRRVGSRYYVPFTITNTGDDTGANVTVEGKLTGQAAKSGTGDETTSTTFDFIPARARAEGIFVFTTDPYAADVRVISYQPP